MLTPCRDDQDFATMLRESATRPIVVFKHSTRCPISSRAHGEVERFAREQPDAECRVVLVVEQRPLSQAIAAQTGVAHQSPQVLLVKDGAVVWQASHYAITCDALTTAYQQAE